MIACRVLYEPRLGWGGDPGVCGVLRRRGAGSRRGWWPRLASDRRDFRLLSPSRAAVRKGRRGGGRGHHRQPTRRSRDACRCARSIALFLQAYVPRLMTSRVRSCGSCWIAVTRSRRRPLLGRSAAATSSAIDRFAARQRDPGLQFGKGDVQGADRAPLLSSRRARGPLRRGADRCRAGEGDRLARAGAMAARTAIRISSIGRQRPSSNHYYFYIARPGLGPGVYQDLSPMRRSRRGCMSTGTSGPSARPPKAGLAFDALDNGFRPSRTPRRWRRSATACRRATCERFFAAGRRGCRRRSRRRTVAAAIATQLAFRQLEISDTRVFDRPAVGRAWFEQTLRDQLTLGRPDQVSRRVRPARQPPDARTLSHARSSRAASSPRSRCTTGPRRSSNTSRKAARCGPKRRSTTRATSASGACSPRRTGTRSCASAMTSTSACSTPNCRRASARPTPRRSNASCCRPLDDGQPAPGLRFGDPRAMALLACLCAFGHLLRRAHQPLAALARRRPDPRLQPHDR